MKVKTDDDTNKTSLNVNIHEIYCHNIALQSKHNINKKRFDNEKDYNQQLPELALFCKKIGKDIYKEPLDEKHRSGVMQSEVDNLAGFKSFHPNVVESVVNNVDTDDFDLEQLLNNHYRQNQSIIVFFVCEKDWINNNSNFVGKRKDFLIVAKNMLYNQFGPDLHKNIVKYSNRKPFKLRNDIARELHRCEMSIKQSFEYYLATMVILDDNNDKTNINWFQNEHLSNKNEINDEKDEKKSVGNDQFSWEKSRSLNDDVESLAFPRIWTNSNNIHDFESKLFTTHQTRDSLLTNCHRIHKLDTFDLKTFYHNFDPIAIENDNIESELTFTIDISAQTSLNKLFDSILDDYYSPQHKKQLLYSNYIAFNLKQAEMKQTLENIEKLVTSAPITPALAPAAPPTIATIATTPTTVTTTGIQVASARSQLLASIRSGKTLTSTRRRKSSQQRKSQIKPSMSLMDHLKMKLKARNALISGVSVAEEKKTEPMIDFDLSYKPALDMDTEFLGARVERMRDDLFGSAGFVCVCLILCFFMFGSFYFCFVSFVS